MTWSLAGVVPEGGGGRGGVAVAEGARAEDGARDAAWARSSLQPALAVGLQPASCLPPLPPRASPGVNRLSGFPCRPRPARRQDSRSQSPAPAGLAPSYSRLPSSLRPSSLQAFARSAPADGQAREGREERPAGQSTNPHRPLY